MYRADNINIYEFASITRTKGYAANQFLVTNANEAGYVGRDIEQAQEPLDYFADYQDNPQLKLHLNIEFPADWKFWLQYTQQGST